MFVDCVSTSLVGIRSFLSHLLFAILMHLAQRVVVLVCVSACSTCFASEHAHVVYATHQSLAWHDVNHLAVPQNGCAHHPKQWRYMSSNERAEIWPFLSPRMQHHYWSSMTAQEKSGMQERLTPIARYQLRHRFVVASQASELSHTSATLNSESEADDCVMRTALSPRSLSTQERALLRSQVKEMDRIKKEN